MSSPAPVTSRQDWDDVIYAIDETITDIRDLRADIAQRRAETEGEDPMFDDAEAADRDAELYEQLRRERLDLETDGVLDGDYDPDPPNDPHLEA